MAFISLSVPEVVSEPHGEVTCLSNVMGETVKSDSRAWAALFENLGLIMSLNSP